MAQLKLSDAKTASIQHNCCFAFPEKFRSNVPYSTAPDSQPSCIVPATLLFMVAYCFSKEHAIALSTASWLRDVPRSPQRLYMTCTLWLTCLWLEGVAMLPDCWCKAVATFLLACCSLTGAKNGLQASLRPSRVLQRPGIYTRPSCAHASRRSTTSTCRRARLSRAWSMTPTRKG